MRYLSKQFETTICQSYRPFLIQEREQKRSSELFFVNYGLSEHIADEVEIREKGSLAAHLGKRRLVAELPNEKSEYSVGFCFANGVNQICFQERANEEILGYCMRLGYILGEGKETVNVAIIEPNKEDCRFFSKYGIAYHILTNVGMMKYGYVNGDKIGCGRCQYDFLVLPSEVILNKWVEEYVRNFFMNGGKLLLLGNKPVCDGKNCAYLENTCTFWEIKSKQIYQCKNPATEIYTTYRDIYQMKLLYAVNASETTTYEQTFDFGEKIHSFLKIDLIELTTENVPLTITLRPGENMILMPYTHQAK